MLRTVGALHTDDSRIRHAQDSQQEHPHSGNATCMLQTAIGRRVHGRSLSPVLGLAQADARARRGNIR
jgi:hypothetical protein